MYVEHSEELTGLQDFSCFVGSLVPSILSHSVMHLVKTGWIQNPGQEWRGHWRERCVCLKTLLEASV